MSGVDQEFRYAAYRVGRPRRTKEVRGPDGEIQTIEEGTLTFDPIGEDEIEMTKEDDWWRSFFTAPDGGVGFDGAVVAYDLEGILRFPEPMTDEEAGEWLDDNPKQWRQFVDDQLESDLTAEDFLDEVL